MKVKDLIAMDMDIDVYDDVCEELGVCFCGPVKLTSIGAWDFMDVMDYEVSVGDDCAIVHIDDEEGVWQKKLERAKKFFNSAAGYCPVDEYEKWFA